MLTRKKSLFFLGGSLLSSAVGIFLLSDRSLLTPLQAEWAGVFVAITLFLSSLFLIRLTSSDSGFSAWKKFVKYFAAIVVVLAILGVYRDSGGSWAVGGDLLPMIPLTVAIYVIGSIIVILRFRKP